MPFGPSSFIGDLTGGFNTESGRVREENTRRAELDAARDEKLFTALANADDDEIRAAAVTGLLTGNHPARGFDKFFGKVGTHPAYDQIKGLVGQGRQAFLGATERARRTAEVTRSGNISGAFSGLDESGVIMTPEQRTRAGMGMVGGAQPVQKMVRGTLVFTDGTSAAGFADEVNGIYQDDDGNQRRDIARFVPSGNLTSGGGSPTAGGAWNKMTAGQYKQQFGESPLLANVPDGTLVQVRVGPDGKAKGDPVLTQGPPASFSFIPTPEGIFAGNNRAGSVRMAGGGAGVQRPATPAANVNALRAAEQSILRLHPQPKPIHPAIPVSAKDMAIWRAVVDAEAVKYGYQDFADLQAQIGTAVQGVGVATPQPPPAPPAGRGRTAPAKPRDPVVDGILKELGY